MASTSDIKNGLCMKFNNGVYTVIEFLHVKPGKGPAFVRTKLKNLETGKVLDNTFPSGFKIDAIRVERRTYQFLYKDGDLFNVMNTSTFDQIAIPEIAINAPKLLKEEDTVEVLFNTEDESILTCELRASVELEVSYTEPGIKGDTATNAMKPATLETGAEIKVPLFINIGDKVKVDTKTASYMERVKA